MPPISEVSAASGYAQINHMTAEIVRLRKKVEEAEDARICHLALVLIVCCACAIALGHFDPGFHPSGGVYLWIALVLAFKAIADVFVAHQQTRLALALLAQRSVTNETNHSD